MSWDQGSKTPLKIEQICAPHVVLRILLLCPRLTGQTSSVLIGGQYVATVLSRQARVKGAVLHTGAVESVLVSSAVSSVTVSLLGDQPEGDNYTYGKLLDKKNGPISRFNHKNL